jgi:hypothetical protein
MRLSRLYTHERVVERRAHDFDGMENSHRVDRVIASFVASGDERKVDASCVARIRPPPFAPP